MSMRRLLSPLMLAAALVAAAVPAAQADCPGSSASACPYAGLSQNGVRGGGVLRFPQAVAVGPDGAVYITDQGSHIVQQFAPDGTWLRDIGTAGSRPGELSAMGAVAVTGDNQVVVADGGTNRIVRFDATGANLFYSLFDGQGVYVRAGAALRRRPSRRRRPAWAVQGL